MFLEECPQIWNACDFKAGYKQGQIGGHRRKLFGTVPAVSNYLSLVNMENVYHLKRKVCQLVEIG